MKEEFDTAAPSPTPPPPSSRPASPSSVSVPSRPLPNPSDPALADKKPNVNSEIPQPSSIKPQMGVAEERRRRDKSRPRRPRLEPQAHAASAPAGRLPLAKSADYVGPSPSSYVRSSTTITELANLVKQQSYQEQKHLQCKARLQKSLIATGLSARLVRSGEISHKSLVDHFKSDQKSEFATLYNALHDVRNSCEANRRFAMLDPDLIAPKLPKSSEDAEEHTGASSFLEDLPYQARETILSFLSNIRSNPSFLASRLARLSNAELESLVRFHHQPNPQESILPNQGGRRGAASRTPAPSIPVASPVERLLSFHRNDPLYTLLHSVFANTTGPDSPEDQRKLDVWSSVCARLITENKGESLVLCVMDAWAAMREWPAAANLEICLMGLLQEGQFLIDRGDDSTTVKTSDSRGKHDLLAEEFWSRAERKLFEVLDDEPGAGGIPEGVLELGHAILQKIENPKTQRHAAMVILVKWFFNRFLANGIAYPEYHGIMNGHHISEHARLKVFRPVLKNMYNHAVSVVFGDWKTNSPVEPVIRTHVENLMERFYCPRPINTHPVLVSSKTITAASESTKVQPFLVLCPVDIVTLSQTIFPHIPGSHAESRDIKSVGSRGSSRIFGKSPGFDTGNGSILSNSSSSVTSEAASMTAPLLDRSSFPDDRRSFMSIPSPAPSTFNMPPPSLAGSDAGDHVSAGDVRSAVETMKGRLGMDAISGRCHPCAEKWAIVYISRGGEHLSLSIPHDYQNKESHEQKDDDSSDDDDEDTASEFTGVNRDYDQLKHAVLKLVEEYEIPEDVSKNEPEAPEDRPMIVTSNSEPGPPSSPPRTVLDPSNPFHQNNLSNLSAMFAKPAAKPPAPDRSYPSPVVEQERKKQAPTPLLVTMLHAAYSQCYARGDFVNAQLFFRAAMQLRKVSPSLQRNDFAPLLHIFSHGARRAIDTWSSAVNGYEDWFEWIALANERHDAAIQDMMKRTKSLRDKMWYVTDVRNSAAYDEARSVTLALKKMGAPQARPQPTRAGSGRSTGRNLTHRASSFSLLKSDTLIDILAAPNEHGGPNKLSDEQVTLTNEYLTKYWVENLCKGEERIHRFCLEIDRCVSKLVGDGILEGPVLWSSELFSRDEKEMSINRQKGDLFIAGVGTLSVAGDDDGETDRDDRGPSSRRGGLDSLRRPSTSDLFGRNRSANLFSSMHDPHIPLIPSSSFSRKNITLSKLNTGLMDMMDRQDLFSMPSPAIQSESHHTFWAPFSSHQSHTSAVTGRPKTTHSPTTLSKSTETINNEKKRFLGELKQTLTGLLLSDLGLEAFSKGSETDAWFSGGLGDDCIQRKQEQEEAKRKREERKKAVRNGSGKSLSKRKSMKNIRKEKASSSTFEALGKDKKGELAAPVATLENIARELHSGEENSSSSDATARARTVTASTPTKKGSSMAFPYDHAFRRLLNKFSIHPNPFHKLHALYELELLIVASLSQRSSRSSSEKRPSIPEFNTSPFLGALGDANSRVSTLQLAQASNIEEAIHNFEERRSNVMNTSAAAGAPRPGSTAPSTDMIVDVLQSLFRQADIRPATLFRDLQFVAAFVPASVLDMTEIGKAFWDTGLAALGLKQDVCRTMVEIADEIVAGESRKRANETAGSGKEKSGRESEPEPYSRYSMEEAATMLMITAKEGDPTAQRELAIFYLTNPSLLPRTTKPLSKAKDTFRPEMMVAKGEDPEKRDPATICVSYHWMELSANGGDDLAKKYLKSQPGW